MKFSVGKEQIIEGLQSVQSIVNTRTPLPVPSNVLLNGSDGKGWLTTTDLEVSVRVGVEAKIAKGEKLNVYMEVESIGGAAFDAMAEKFNFFKEIGFGFSHFNRIAVVTHSKWLHRVVDLEDLLFRNVDMKGFQLEDKEKAIEFLKTS